jgi:protein-disulfide isomerase
MAHIRFFLFLLTTALLAQAPDWRAVTTLPAVDFAGLTAAQKQTALELLRASDCTCQCQMKLAECRVKDPGCGDSRELASIAVREIKAGKSPAAIQKLLADSSLARQRREALFAEPVPLVIEGAPSRGPVSAKLVLVEFSDFQCPYCRTAARHVDKLLELYPKDLRVVFKQFPLEKHSDAALAAEASLAAHAQGKFWPLHDRVFRHSGRITRAQLAAWAMETGIDLARFNREMDAGKYRAAVEREAKEGELAGVQGTPSFFVNGRHYRGSVDPAAFKPVLDKLLQAGK